VIVASASEDVRLTLTTFNGDADLLASVHSSNMRPTTADADFMSSSIYNDTLYIQSTDLVECQAMKQANRPVRCEVFVGIYGFKTSSFAILATVGSKNEQILQDGQPLTGVVSAGEPQYYYALVDVHQGARYSVQLVPTRGDPDLYVLMDAPPGIHAGISNYTFESHAFGGEDVVAIGPDRGDNYKTHTRMGITVRGWTDAEYTILYSSSEVISRLLDGVSQFGDVAQGEYRYFSVSVDQPNQVLQITTTEFSGDVEVYVKVEVPGGSNNRPTMSNYTWSAQSFGDDIVRISNAKSYCPAALQQTGCNFIIGVYGWQESSFSVTATTGATTITRLSDGVPIHNTGNENEMQYYTFYGAPGSNYSISIAATTTMGAVGIYVVNDYMPGDYSKLPTPTSWTWSTANPSNPGGRSGVIIDPNDPKRPANGYYGIGILTLTPSASFTLAATTNDDAMTLRFGTPSPVRVFTKGGTTHHFTLLDPNTRNGDVVLSMNVFKGEAYLLLSRREPLEQSDAPHCSPGGSPSSGALPNCRNSTWATMDPSVTLLRVVHTVPCENAQSPPIAGAVCDPIIDFAPGRFWIGVYTDVPGTTYSVTALTNSQNRLTPGQPQTGESTSEMPGYYLFSTVDDSSTPDIRLAVTKIDSSTGQPSASATDLVVYMYSCRSNACTDQDRHPSRTHSMVVQGVTDLESELVLTPASAGYCDSSDGSCSYFFTIAPVCDNVQNCRGRYTVELDVQSGGASTSAVAADRTDHKVAQLPGFAPQGTSALYEFYLEQDESGAASDIRMDLQACTGSYPTAYVCDPSGYQGKHCSDPFNPSSS